MFILCLWMLFTSACVHNQLTIGVVWQARANKQLIPLYIEMPRNNKNFEHLSPLLYEELIKHCTHAGYQLVSRKEQGYRLSLLVTDFYPERKFVSPDILLFHATYRLQCTCVVYNYVGEEVFRQNFSTSKLFSNPRNPVVSGNYFSYEFGKMVQSLVPMIEYRIRPYLIKRT